MQLPDLGLTPKRVQTYNLTFPKTTSAADLHFLQFLLMGLQGHGKFSLHGSHTRARSLSRLPEGAPQPADDGRVPTLRGHAPPAMSQSTAGTAGCKNCSAVLEHTLVLLALLLPEGRQTVQAF